MPGYTLRSRSNQPGGTILIDVADGTEADYVAALRKKTIAAREQADKNYYVTHGRCAALFDHHQGRRVHVTRAR